MVMARSMKCGSMNMVSQVEYVVETARDLNKSCYRCQIKFKKGDIVHTNGHVQNRRTYHKDCWEKLLY